MTEGTNTGAGPADVFDHLQALAYIAAIPPGQWIGLAYDIPMQEDLPRELPSPSDEEIVAAAIRAMRDKEAQKAAHTPLSDV